MYSTNLPHAVKDVMIRIKNTFAFHCEVIFHKKLDTPAILKQLLVLFRELYTNEVIEEIPDKKAEELKQLVAKQWTGYFYKMIWRLYLKPDVENFGELFFQHAPLDFKIELIRKFLVFTIRDYQDLEKYQLAMIKELVK